jgi:hypothetical protein
MNIVGQTVLIVACVISFPLFNAAQGVSQTSQSDGPDKPQKYVVEPLEKNRRQKEAEIREFIWSHWKERQPGSLSVTSYSKEGVENLAELFWKTT